MILSPLSKSTWSTFEKCPWKAHAHKNLGMPSEAGPAAEMGVVVHDIIAKVLKGEVSLSSVDIISPSDEATDLVKRYTLFDDFKDNQLFVEERAMVDEFGKKTELECQAIIHGFLDVFWRESAEVARFKDWKTGRWEQWNPFESHVYALATRASFPGVTKVKAELCFLRSGNSIVTEYEWQENDRLCLVTQNGKTSQLWSEKDPILEYVLVRIDQILVTDPEPRPGSHCSNWYGKPCQFFGKECPLTPKEDLMRQTMPVLSTGSRYAKALGVLLKGDKVTPMVASDGLYAVQQMKQIVSQAEDRIKEWSRDNGPIAVGKSYYGWKSILEYKVDIPFVIQTLMDHNVPFEDWGRVVNVSKTSIGRLPKREYGEVRSLLETFAVEPAKGKERFVELKSKEGE